MTIQQRLKNKGKCSEEDIIKRDFVRELSKGNTKATLCLISKDNRSSILHLSDTVPTINYEHASFLNILKSKHPPGEPPSEDFIFKGAHIPSTVHPVIFDSIIGRPFAVRHSALVVRLELLVLIHKAGGYCAPLLRTPQMTFATFLLYSPDDFARILLTQKASPHLCCAA